MKKNKYSNIKKEFNGIKFDSLKELRRYKELLILESAGEIVDLEVHPKFLLQESFKYNDKTISVLNYTADFQYIDIKTNKLTVEDVKGILTTAYNIKKKLFLKKYGKNLNFYEI